MADIDVPVKRKIEKKREKVLRFESILERNPFVKAVPSSILKKPKKKDIVAAVVQSQDAKVNKVSTSYGNVVEVGDSFVPHCLNVCFHFFQEGKDSESDIFDIWNDQSNFHDLYYFQFQLILLLTLECESQGVSHVFLQVKKTSRGRCVNDNLYIFLFVYMYFFFLHWCCLGFSSFYHV